MKTKLFFTSVFVIFFLKLNAQAPGEWTWMNGVESMNFIGNYGTIGVASATNMPPGVYEAVEWTDSQNNFWFYGGQSVGIWFNNLWKYNVLSNQWTWVNGYGNVPDIKPVYGIRGVAAMQNTPGERCESQSWVDNQNNLWLLGGISYLEPGGACTYNDLWNYSVSDSMWTWMKGDTVPICGWVVGHYGLKGVEDSLNNPLSMDERDITWTDNNNNLWMLDFNGCLWKYRIQSNNWTWIKGDTNAIAVYGQQGIASLNNTPGNNFYAYTRWKDSKGNFWLYYTDNTFNFKHIFRYEINTNMWTWVWGDTIQSTVSYYGDTLCDYEFEGREENAVPFSRVEARACWIDNCDNLWLMGGIGYDHSTIGDFNDLIYFDTHILKWIWAGNDTTHSYNSVYSTMGVSSPLNKPAARSGAIPFKDASGNLWLYGGINVNSGGFHYGDLWKYTMDNGCPPCETPYHAGIAEENITTEKVSIYPNPFSSQTVLQTDKGFKNAILKLYNSLGQQIKQINNISSLTITLTRDNLLCGLYFLQLIQDNKTLATDKLIIVDN